MTASGLHRQIAAPALAAAGEHGFAPGGGSAPLARGVISRPTQDAGLFTGQEHGGQAAAGAVQAARRGAGFEPERQDQAAGLTGIFPGMGEGLAEWIVTAPAGSRWRCNWLIPGSGPRAGAHGHRPGPGPGRCRGRKVCALASRIEPRDYADVAAALQRYAPGQLIRCARRLDPAWPAGTSPMPGCGRTR